jgi:hypothetical protein
LTEVRQIGGKTDMERGRKEGRGEGRLMGGREESD